MMRSCIALLALAAVSGCGDVKSIASDSGTGEGDAGASADAGNTIDPLSGTWSWWIGSEKVPDARCDVTIGGGQFDVYCPSDPVMVVDGCMRTKNDLQVRGAWNHEFSGSVDEIERYEGAACPGAGYPTVDEDIVQEGIVSMAALHSETSQEAGFLELAYGVWDWTLIDPDAVDSDFGCAVSFGPRPGEAVAFRVECLQEPTEPILDCTETEATVIEGSLDASSMTGEGWDEDRYAGTGCGVMYPDPVVEGTRTLMGASRQ